MKRLAAAGGALVLVLVVVVGWLWYCSLPVDSSQKVSVEVVVDRGIGVRELARVLKDKDLIRSRIAFFSYLKLTGLDTKIQAGKFKLSKSMDLAAVANALLHGVEDTKITIPEGWRREQIEEKFGVTIPPQFEGRLFPDTYLIPLGYDSNQVVEMMTANFAKKVPGITAEQLIIASLVEREAKTEADRTGIAGVLLNRLKIGMKLDVDATVQYAIGFTKNDGWWKKGVTLDDLKFKSPFNTYLISGLPPGPICNPGLAAINAVLNPTKSDYLFYITDGGGVTHYAKTLQEHNLNVDKYLNK